MEIRMKVVYLNYCINSTYVCLEFIAGPDEQSP